MKDTPFEAPGSASRAWRWRGRLLERLEALGAAVTAFAPMAEAMNTTAAAAAEGLSASIMGDEQSAIELGQATTEAGAAAEASQGIYDALTNTWTQMGAASSEAGRQATEGLQAVAGGAGDAGDVRRFSCE